MASSSSARGSQANLVDHFCANPRNAPSTDLIQLLERSKTDVLREEYVKTNVSEKEKERLHSQIGLAPGEVVHLLDVLLRVSARQHAKEVLRVRAAAKNTTLEKYLELVQLRRTRIAEMEANSPVDPPIVINGPHSHPDDNARFSPVPSPPSSPPRSPDPESDDNSDCIAEGPEPEVADLAQTVANDADEAEISRLLRNVGRSLNTTKEAGILKVLLQDKDRWVAFFPGRNKELAELIQKIEPGVTRARRHSRGRARTRGKRRQNAPENTLNKRQRKRMRQNRMKAKKKQGTDENQLDLY